MPSVLMIGSEAVPYAKTGGLADVLGALPLALGASGVGRHRRRCLATAVCGGSRSIERVAVSVGGYTREIGLFDAPMTDGARALLVDCPDLYDRDSLYGPATSTIRTTRAASRCWCVRRSNSWRGAATSVDRARPRLAGGPGAGLPEHDLRVASGLAQHADGLHDSQHCVPRRVRSRLAAAPRSGLGRARRRSTGILGPNQPAKGRSTPRR